MGKTAELRKGFVDYFGKNGHQCVDSSSLVPRNDDSLLFTNSGMVQFKNYFIGSEVAPYTTAVTVQKCLRAGGKHNDLDNVGYTARHHTFFEMLGNFSFGDYFKEKAIYYAWMFLTKEVAINKDKLLVTIYHNDEEAYNFWKKIAGLDDKRIIRIETADNFWEMGDSGPCGPCSEIFYDHGENIFGGPPGSKDAEGERFIEIWNIVFMQYEKLRSGELINLSKPCIDTGMGLERFASVLAGVHDNYDTDIFTYIIEDIQKQLNVKITKSNQASFKVIADHLRSSAFMIAEGILPSNEGRGYVLRRILRRAVRHAYILGAKDPVIHKIFPALKMQMADFYKELDLHSVFIEETIKQEEVKFHETFSKGIKLLQEEIDKTAVGKVFSGKTAFKLYDTYGFPLDLTKDILYNQKISLNETEFDDAFEKHKSLAKTSWQGSGENKEDVVWLALNSKLSPTNFTGYNNIEGNGKIISILIQLQGKLLEVASLEQEEGYIITDNTPFYAELGGQIGDKGYISASNNMLMHVIDTQKRGKSLFVHKVKLISGKVSVADNVILRVDSKIRQDVARHHSVAHLLHASLRKHLGGHVTQQGSMVSDLRLRFDISHNQALSLEEIKKVEDSINQVILANLPIEIESMPLENAISKGAMALFGEKYPDIARTVKIGSFNDDIYSFELCAGTHVRHTGECGIFKIVSEGSIASGVRRIEGVCGHKALEYFAELDARLNSMAALTNSDSKNLVGKVTSILEENKKLRKDLSNLNSQYYLNILQDKFEEFKGMKLLFSCLNNIQSKDLKDIASNVLYNKTKSVIFIYTKENDRAFYIIAISKDMEATFNLKELNKKLLNYIAGTGGGSMLSVQGQGDYNKLCGALPLLKNHLDSNN